MSKPLALADLEREIAKGRSESEEYDLAHLEAEAEIELGELLHGALRESGLKKMKLAERLGITRPAVTQFFDGGYARAGYPTLVRYFQAMGKKLRFSTEAAYRKASAMKKVKATQKQGSRGGVRKTASASAFAKGK